MNRLRYALMLVALVAFMFSEACSEIGRHVSLAIRSVR